MKKCKYCTKLEAKDKNGKEVYIGDVIKIKAMRVSSSHSSWCRETNVNHGNVYLKAKVISLRGSLEYDESAIKRIEEPQGKELNKQQLLYTDNIYETKWLNDDFIVIKKDLK